MKFPIFHSLRAALYCNRAQNIKGVQLDETTYRCCGERNHCEGDRGDPFIVTICMVHERVLPFHFLVEALAELLEDGVDKGITL